MIVFSASLIFLSSARTYENAERPETTYSEEEKTWNELQRARNDLQPEPTSKKKDLKQPTASRFWDCFTIWGNHVVFYSTSNCNYSSIASRRIMMEIEPHTFIYYYAHLLREIKFVGCVTNHLGTCKLTFVKSQRPTLWIKLPIKIKFWQR